MAELREDVLELKQEQLAKLLGLAVSTLSRYEQGRASFPLEVVVRVAILAKVSLDWLLRPTDADRVWLVDLDQVDDAKANPDGYDFRKSPVWRTIRRRSQVRRSSAEMQDLFREITGDDLHADWY